MARKPGRPSYKQAPYSAVTAETEMEQTEVAAIPEQPSATAQPINGMEKARRGRAPVDPNESKHDKLLRLASARVTKACRAIQLVGGLANYKPSEKEIEMIEQALGESCAACINRLNGIRKQSINFSLR